MVRTLLGITRAGVVPTNVGDHVLNLLEKFGALIEMANLEVLILEQLMIAGGTASIHVLVDKMLKGSQQVIQSDESAPMDQPLLLAPFEHRVSEWGVGWAQLLLADDRIPCKGGSEVGARFHFYCGLRGSRDGEAAGGWCVILHFFPATCGPKGHGSGGCF